MKKISVSENIENFNDRYIYIDKTEYIYNLITNYERVFFSRPRRFGKSLTLNTIRTLFEKGVDPYFKDTWIYNKWDQDKYPVLHLSFLEYPKSNIDEFNEMFSLSISDFAKVLGYGEAVSSKKPNRAIIELFNVLEKKDQQIVILIDEYDCQLTANINNPSLYEEFKKCIRDFYAVIKGKKQIS